MFKLDDEPKRDEVAEEEVEEKATPRKRSRSKSRRATKSEGVSGKIATSVPEVKPVETLELNEDIPDLESLAEAIGSGVIPPTPEPEPELVGDVGRVIVRSTWPSRMIVANSPSGEIYDFNGAGALLSVNAADVQHLLSQNRTNARGCCGGGHDKRKFELT